MNICVINLNGGFGPECSAHYSEGQLPEDTTVLQFVVGQVFTTTTFTCGTTVSIFLNVNICHPNLFGVSCTVSIAVPLNFYSPSPASSSDHLQVEQSD